MSSISLFKFKFKLYQNHFKQPLRTSHGIWQIRQGIIISLTNQLGVTYQGEIAPLPWFGSETINEALKFCQQLRESTNIEEILAIPDTLPCCQFALESAYLAFTQIHWATPLSDLNLCYLLPAGKAALTAWQDLYQVKSAKTFKWKIGVLPLKEEIAILQQLTTELPSEVKLRLDANGGLNLAQAQQLLSVTDFLPGIEFIEQPLAITDFDSIWHLNQEHATVIALDESIASFKQLQQAHQQGWDGVYVIKAAIMGFPSRLIQFCHENNLDLVFSSVLETTIARQTVLNLAQQLNHPRALGFGVEQFYE